MNIFITKFLFIPSYRYKHITFITKKLKCVYIYLSVKLSHYHG